VTTYRVKQTLPPVVGNRPWPPVPSRASDGGFCRFPAGQKREKTLGSLSSEPRGIQKGALLWS